MSDLQRIEAVLANKKEQLSQIEEDIKVLEAALKLIAMEETTVKPEPKRWP